MYNIQKNKKCVICMVDEHNLEKMHFSSKELASNISEAEEFSIKTKKYLKVIHLQLKIVQLLMLVLLIKSLN